jgi:hypothetical protein
MTAALQRITNVRRDEVAPVLAAGVFREDKYKSKSFIDTFVYRGGDVVGAWTEGLPGRRRRLKRGHPWYRGPQPEPGMGGLP